MKASIALSTENFCAGLFEIFLNDKCSNFQVDEMIRMVEELVEEYKNERTFMYRQVYQSLSEMFGEGASVEIDSNLCCRTEDDILHIMEEVIIKESYNGLYFLIHTEDGSLHEIEMNKEGSVDILKQFMC